VMVYENSDGDEFDCSGVLKGHTQDIKMVKWNSRLDMIFSASYDDTIKSWRYDEVVDDWMANYSIPGHKSTVWCIDFDPTEKYMVSVGDDKQLMIWKVNEKEFVNCG
jgi:cytosolic iron-sulfur protein assembly protein CIAO1